AYRILLADLVVITMADASTGHAELGDAIREMNAEARVIAVGFRLRPLAPVAGKRVAYFTTARAPAHARLAEQLAELGAEVVLVSGSLSDRRALRRELEGVDAEVFLTEIKAAAIDVVAEAGARRGIEVVLIANEIVPVAGQPELEPALRALADQTQAEPVGT